MAQRSSYAVQNNFDQGLKTEFTGLNFPENACTYSDNCTFERIGNVHRRSGFDYELNYTTKSINRAEEAISTFVWTNVGGDGETKVYVLQVGGTLYFYEYTNATTTSPMSTTLLTSTVNIASFVASGGTFDATQECQYAAGNGFLFVFQPTCDPFFCTFNAGTITATVITVQIRDYAGINEPGVPVTDRPSSLTKEHQYNLQNQGWASSASWGDSSTSLISLVSDSAPFLNTGFATFIVGSSSDPVSVGQSIAISGYITYQWTNGALYNLGCSMSGVITSYSGTTMVVNVGTTVPPLASGFIAGSNAVGAFWNLGPYGAAAQISTWYGQTGVYPSNADVWWQFKDDTDVFNPAVTLPNVTLSSPAPTGSYVVDAFNINRAGVSGIAGLTSISTTVRPRTGTWFQGRVFYAGVDASQQAIGDASYYTWTENIYFSQIITPGDSTEFGYCDEVNDPTSETLFDLLPSDGGVINIQGSGSIYKLFPVVNGLLVFAANGIWFITGSQGIGFTATDYTVTKLSGIQSISGRSFVDVLGYPVFWNEDSIYSVAQGSEGRGLTVSNLGLTTINSFYQAIPLSSRQYARGSYNPLTFQIQWVYKSTQATDTTTTYAFDSILNFNTVTNAFYNWTVSPGSLIHDVTYIVSPGGTNTPDSTFKYLASSKSGGTYRFSFAEERDDVAWLDWGVSNYTSKFITGYNLHGGAATKFQPSYINVYSNNVVNTGYTIQGIWDYALIPDSGRFSSEQLIQNYVSTTNFGVVRRRHRIRGNGYVLQFMITSTPGLAFDIIGWSILETINAGA